MPLELWTMNWTGAIPIDKIVVCMGRKRCTSYIHFIVAIAMDGRNGKLH